MYDKIKHDTKSSRLMCVDGDEHVRNSVKFFFESLYMKVQTFRTAAQGLSALESQNFDFVVSDYLLPDMNGVEFLDMVVQYNSGIRRILMTTIINDEIRLAVIRAGIDRFIEKPLTIASLDTIIGGL